ncbi:MAG TPA: choice-of-anchor tandem repeat GloVer-containing protein [Terriglobales bacterium]
MREASSRLGFVVLQILWVVPVALLAPSFAQSVNLSWEASTSHDTVGYNVYRGHNATGPFSKINSALDPNTAYTDSTVKAGHTYYYVTTAVDGQGGQSGYSNETEAIIPQTGAGSENVLFSFAGAGEPNSPYAGLVFDKSGNLYGTTVLGGTSNQGTVFELTPNSNGSWTQTVLYNFTGAADGGQPHGSLILDSSGSLYGTTNYGGNSNCSSGCGTVFELVPGAGGWTESVLYAFTGASDGREPYARLLFDSAGNLYGTTLQGGNITSACSVGCGTVFELAPASGTWSESVLYAFQGGTDGASPYSGLIFDSKGNLYGTTSAGGKDASGVIFKLSPASGAWTERVLHGFDGGGDGQYPYGDLIADASGNLYGTAYQGGARGDGVVFELQHESGQWLLNVLHAFSDAPAGNPVAGLTLDVSGNVYGTTMLGATESSCAGGCGALFELLPVSGSWQYKLVHTFGRGGDGYRPSGDLVFDSSGNIYGTTQAGGATNAGMVFEIMN